jgi:hypothetical protein
MVVGTALRAGIPVTTEYAMNRWSLMNGTLALSINFKQT